MSEHEWHILTGTGLLLHPLRKDDTSEIDIIDIALGLSAEARYAGATIWEGRPCVYNVADHSVRVAQVLVRSGHPELALEGLLHDGEEYVCKDLPKPVKESIAALIGDCQNGYRMLARITDRRIRLRFGLPLEESPLVKLADTYMLALEQNRIRPAPRTTAEPVAPGGPYQHRAPSAFYEQLDLERPESVMAACSLAGFDLLRDFPRPRSRDESLALFLNAFDMLGGKS